MAKQKKSKPKRLYGIGEWYGRLYRCLDEAERKALLKPDPMPDCPYFKHTPQLAPQAGVKCNKKGGVCSIRNFVAGPAGGLKFGPITATCPNRFLENGLVVKTIGTTILGTDAPLVAKEVPFLKRSVASGVAGTAPVGDPTKKSWESDTDDSAKSKIEYVGRIDLVCVHPNLGDLNWCAVELQAVYFSGGEMSKDYAVIREHVGPGIPMPGAARRPDFRSSGPKRLMPQLQIKVPTLRRWGKKMVVVVDRPFFESLGEMDHVTDLSNSDIVWVIVDYNEDADRSSAKIAIHSLRYTTLERAVEGLTAGHPATLPNFEDKIRQKVSS